MAGMTEEQDVWGAGARTVVVGLLAESGPRRRMLQKLAQELPGELARHVDANCSWEIRVEEYALPFDEEGNITLMANAQELRHQLGCDQVVYLTDLPRLIRGKALLADISVPQEAALISVPALGLAQYRSMRKTVLRVVAELSHGPELASKGQPRLIRRGVLRPVKQRPVDREGGETYSELTGARGYVRLLLGMVRANQPWTLVPALSSAMAAAIGTGAFGVFYSGIWALGNALSPWRLTAISIAAITIMSAWLIAYNGLWDHPEGIHARRKRWIYNTSTLLTVAMAVSLMYAALFMVILLGALTVIAGDYLQTQLQLSQVSFVNYVKLAWLASSMGTIAGALGSSWDSDRAVRQATYSRREYERRAQTSKDWNEQ